MKLYWYFLKLMLLWHCFYRAIFGGKIGSISLFFAKPYGNFGASMYACIHVHLHASNILLYISLMVFPIKTILTYSYVYSLDSFFYVIRKIDTIKNSEQMDKMKLAFKYIDFKLHTQVTILEHNSYNIETDFTIYRKFSPAIFFFFLSVLKLF